MAGGLAGPESPFFNPAFLDANEAADERVRQLNAQNATRAGGGDPFGVLADPPVAPVGGDPFGVLADPSPAPAGARAGDPFSVLADSEPPATSLPVPPVPPSVQLPPPEPPPPVMSENVGPPRLNPAQQPFFRPGIGDALTGIVDTVRGWDWFTPPRAPPTAITNAPVGSTITVPALPTREDLFAPPQARPSAITNAPVGSAVTSPLDTQFHPRTGTGIVMSPVPPDSPAAGSFAAGVESVAQAPYAVGVQQIQRQLDTMRRIDQGEAVNPNDDPLGYSAMTPEQRAKARTDLVQIQQANVGTITGSQIYQQGVPVDPGVVAFQKAESWRDTAAALVNAPVAVLQDVILRQLPGMAGMVGATVAGGPVAGFVAGLAAIGPPKFGTDLVRAMQEAGVDLNDEAARNAWVTANGPTIKTLYDQAMNVGAVTTATQVGPFEAARFLPIASTPGRVATGAGLGAGTGAAAPYVESAITGEPVTPQAVITSASPGAAMGATGGGIGDRAPPPRPRVEPTAARPAEQPLFYTGTDPETGVPAAAVDPTTLVNPQPVDASTLAPRPAEAAVAAPPETPLMEPPPPSPAGRPAPVAEPLPPARVEPVAPAPAGVPTPIAEPLPPARMEPPPPSPEGVPAPRVEPLPRAFPEPTEAPVAPVPPPPGTRVDVGGRPPAPAEIRPEVAPRSEPGVPLAPEPVVRAPEAPLPPEPARLAPGETAKTPEPAQPVARPEPRPVTPEPAPRPEPAPAPATTPEPATEPPPTGAEPKTDLGRRRAGAVNDWLEAVQNPGKTIEDKLSRERALSQLKSSVGKDGGATPAQAAWAEAVNERIIQKHSDAFWGHTGQGRVTEARGGLARDVTQAQGGVRRREQATQQANRLLPTDEGSADTARPSRYFNVFRDAGHAPEDIVNRPLPEQFVIARNQTQKALGFKNITRDPRASWRQSVDQLQDAYQNLRMMAHSLGVPVKTLTLDGTVSLNFSPRRGTGFLGAYDPKTRTIHLSGRANSFAHEYAHALDHYLMDKLRNSRPGYASDQTLARGMTTRIVDNPETARAFSRVLNELLGDKSEMAPHLFDYMLQADSELPRAPGEHVSQREANARAAILDMVRNNPSEYLRRSQQFAELTGSDYWTRAHELFARAFESFVSERITSRDPTAGQEFVTRGERAYLASSDASERLRQAYPKGETRARIVTAMQDLFDTMGRETVLGGGEAAAHPGNLDVVNPKYYTDRTSTVPPEERGLFNRLKALGHEIANTDVRAALRPITEPVTTMRRLGAFARDTMEMGPEGALRGMPTRMKRMFLNTTGGQMIINERKYTGEARAALADIRKSLVTREGAGELYTGVYGKTVAQNKDRHMARLAGDIERTGGPLTDGELAQLNAALRQGEEGMPANTSQRVKDLAARMRQHYNDLLYEANQAGLDIDASLESYVKREFIHRAMQADPPEFRRRAALTYMDEFDQRVAVSSGRTAQLTAELKVAEENATKLRDEANRLKGKPGVVEARKAAAQAEREAARLRRQHGSTIGELMTEANVGEQEDLQANRSAYAQAKAEALYVRAIAGDAENFGRLGPSASFRNERVLPASADIHLRPYYEQNPITAMIAYIEANVNKTEFAHQFGAGNEILQANLDRAARAGVKKEDIDDTIRLVQMLTGQTGGTASTNNVRRTLNFVAATGQMMTMGRSPFASLSEPLLTAFHSQSFGALPRLMRAVIDDIGNTPDGLRRAELAEAMGQITQRTLNESLAQKLGDFTTDKNAWAGKLSRYYYNIWLTRLDNMSRRISVAPGEWYIGKLLERATSGDPADFRARFAQQKLNEFGIGADEVQGVQAWKNDPVRQGKVTADALETPEGQLYRTALARFTELAVTRPTRADVPEPALMGPMGQLAYGLTRFTSAVARNTVLKAVNEFRAQDTWTDSMRTAATNALTYTPYVLGTYLAMQARRALFGYSGDPDKEREQAGIFDAASVVSSVGGFGTLDSAANALASLRFHRDLSAQSGGALLGTWLKALQLTMEGAVGRTVGEPTNTSDRNAIRGLHMLSQIPLGMLFAEVPGAPLLYPFYAYATSPKAGGQLADVIAGEKTSRGSVHHGARPQAPARPARPGH